MVRGQVSIVCGLCIWPGCDDIGTYFTGMQVGWEKKWGYACNSHEKAIVTLSARRALREKIGKRSMPVSLTDISAANLGR